MPASQSASISAELTRLIELLGPCADKWVCITSIYIFGSVARGDATATSDLDLAIEYVSDLEKDDVAMASFHDFQQKVEARSRLLQQVIGRKVSLHGAVNDYRGEDAALPAIRAAAHCPVTTAGKIVVVAIPGCEPQN